MKKTAVILFNLGGPDSLAAVQPFLFNLFSDPAIIRLPHPFRWLLAKLISTRRAPVAQEIYAKMGGRSPILPQTEAQARALEDVLGDGYRVFIAMRYWHPFSDQTAKAVKDWGAQRIVLLPLYPQFSTTTTASSFKDWHRAAAAAGLNVPTSEIVQYETDPGFIAAQTELLRERLAEAESKGAEAGTGVRILFSAHGLPKKIVDAGDPYQKQVEASVAAVLKLLDRPELDSGICYQSRVGPLEWIGPATDAEITRAALEKRAIVVVPIAFVSEHSETLVELDIEYAELAQHNGAAAYIRIPTVGVQPAFIAGLAGLVRQA
ncbi:ferrochelatase [Ferrovibrio sp.]|uniref:ferrochelatase n=1 Tax=Ferrovibrio sp. TaxID=1917215 RepID=UPI000CC4FBE2|nr:ferrochelatase [Ferrovibrio sp.]PJI38468.1 MAG: ferrochelatase [Ferrovibrio sp.]